MRIRFRTSMALLLVASFGFAAKLYPGPGRWWVNDWGPASVAYVVFFMLVVFAILPRRGAVTPIAVAVCLVTCLLECVQLWQPPWLQAIRSTFVGGSFLGTTFSWWDFPAYFVGAIVGWLLLRWLACRSVKARMT